MSKRKPKVEVPGVGPVSRLRAAKIHVYCRLYQDEYFRASMAVEQRGQFTEKEIRQALNQLCRDGVLENYSYGAYRWRTK